MDPDPAGDYLITAFSFADFFANFGPYLLGIVLLLFLSAIASASEIAYFSLSRSEVEAFKTQDSIAARTVVDLLHKPRVLLATFLIYMNLVNVGIILVSSLALRGSAERYGWDQTEWQRLMLQLFEVVIITFILLFFGEITPKVLAIQKRTTIAPSLALLLRALRTVLYPLSWVLINSTRFVDRRVAREVESASNEEIKMAIDLTSEEESPEGEKQILKGLVDFSTISAKSIMTSRVDMKAIDMGMPFSEVVEQINEYGFSRIPVYEESPDHIKGILYVKDLLPLLNREGEPDWHSLLRPPLFVPETKKIDDLLEDFREKRLHIAVVVDEFGGTAGIVTLEDIVDEIFGEIRDEFDSEELVFSRLSDHEFVFDGRTPLHELIEATGIREGTFDEVRADKDSLAGLILEIHGKIPIKGDVIAWEGFRFHIESATQNRIRRVKLVIPQNEGEVTA